MAGTHGLGGAVLIGSARMDLKPAGEAGSGKPNYAQSVPAVEQATRILFFLANGAKGSATLSDICREVEISKSKGLAILTTLRQADLVTKNERLRTYELGPSLLVLSRALLQHTDLAQEAAPYLDDLVSSTGCTSFLGVAYRDRLVVWARREPTQTMGIAVGVGHRFPLTMGAHGKAILAALPPAELERVLAEGSLLAAGEEDRESVDIDALRRELDEFRRLGYAYDVTTGHGIGAVSAALIRHAAPPTAGAFPVAGCLVVVGAFGIESVAPYGERVAAVAREMRANVGSLQ
jgi:DNA-binding IclR family transcriptional regulator